MKNNLLKFSLFTFLILSLSFTAIQQFELHLLKSTSGLNFSIKHLGITDFNGAFTDFESSITTSSDLFTDAQVSFTAKASSVNTFNEQRDHHLRSSDFLDTENHPTITFVSTSIKKGKKGSFTITGDFTLHGVTKSISVDAKLTGKHVNSENQSELYGLKIKGQINRLDFGVGEKYPNEMLSDIVTFEANLTYQKELK